MKRHQALRRILKRALVVLGWVLLSVCAVVLLALSVIAFQPRAVTHIVSQALQPVFEGSLEITDAQVISLDHVEGVDALLRDPEGRVVAEIHDLSASLPLFDVLNQLVRGGPKLTIDLKRVQARYARIDLSTNSEGELRLAGALVPKPSDKKKPNASSQEVVVRLRSIVFEQAWIHGAPTPALALDVGVERLAAALLLDGSGLTIGPVNLQADARVAGPARQVGLDFQGTGRLNIEVKEEPPSQGAPRIPALFESLHFAATLTQGESRVVLTGDQEQQELSLLAQGTYIPDEGVLAQRTPIFVDASVRGSLDDLRAETRLETSGMTSRLELASHWNEELVIDGKWTVDDFSLALLDEGAPASTIDARIEFQGRRSPTSRLPASREDDPEWAHWNAQLDGSFSALSFGGENVPALNLRVRYSPPDWSVRLETAQGEGRTRVVATGALDRNLPPDRLNVAGRLDISELRPYLPGLRKGTGLVQVSGQISPAKSEIEAEVDLEIADAQYQTTVSARKVQAQGRLTGKLTNPQFVVRAEVHELDLLAGTPQARHFEQVDVRWSGSFSSSQLNVLAKQEERTIEVRTRLAITPRLGVDQTHVVMRGEGDAVSLSVDRIDVDSGGIRLTDVKFSGLGEGELSGTVNRSGVTVKGYARNVPVEAVAERFSLDLSGARGEVDLDADFKLGPGAAEGRVRMLLTQAGVEEGPRPVKEVPLLDVHLDVIGEGRQLALITKVTPSKKRGTSSQVEAHVSAIVPEGALFKQPGAWMDRVLNVNAQGSLDMAWIPAALLPKHTDVAGRLDFRTTLERPNEGAVPSASLFVRTLGLRVTVPREGKIEGQEVTLTTFEDLDFTASVSHVPERGTTRGWVGAFQGQRMLGYVRGHVDATLTSLNFPEGLNSYRDAPLEVEAELLRTSLDALPEGVPIEGAKGDLSLSLALAGSIARPDLTARAELQGFSMDHVRERRPVDAYLTLEYANRIAEAELRVLDGSKEGERLLARVRAQFENEISAGAIALERIDANATVNELSMDAYLPTNTAEGTLSGEVTVERYGTADPRLEMDLDLGHMSMGGVPFEGGRLRAEADADSAEVFVDFEGREFVLRADVKTGLVWRNNYVPSLGDVATGQIVSQRFPLRTLSPLVSSAVANLDGLVDAELRGSIQGGAPVLSGKVVVSEGSIQFPLVGQQFRDVKAEIDWAKNGQVTLKKASFRGVTGRARVKGGAQMNGLRPESANFQLQVDRTDRLPLSVQGLGVGEFWGDVRGKVDLSWENNRIKADVDFREFQVVFPEIVTGSVQSLKPDEHVSAGVWVNEKEFVVVPLQPVEKKKESGESWTVQTSINLGKNFWVQQGPTRRIRIGGGILIAAEEEATVEGQLSLSQGRIQLNGRMFEIEEGTVTFQPGDPANPIIVAEARWQSPEGTVVIARFLGPVQSGEMTLTSEPPLPQDQIVSLLLFGDTTGLNGPADSGGGSSDTPAVAVGGGVATQGLNQALSRVEAVDISTRIDTAGGDAVRPEVVIQLTNSVSAQVGYNLEEPSPGESPDRTVVSLEVRLRGGNSVSATLGDRGSSFFDWVWRYRY